MSRQVVQPFDADCSRRGAKACRFDDRRFFSVSVTTLCLLLHLLTASSICPEPSLAVLRAGIQQSEDAPFAPGDFRFLPGDFVYLTFDVAGFGVRTDKDAGTRHLSLRYEITPEDSGRVPLVAPLTGAIDADLNPEDKSWTPKRRASFVLPSFVAAGRYQVHVAVHDLIAKTQVATDVPFLIGGIEIPHSDAFSAEKFAFLRKESDRDPLEVPAYAPGDTVFARFDMVAFKTGKNHEYDLSYGISVFRPDGKPFLNDPHAAELKGESFYPAKYLPGSIAVTVPPNASRGLYVLTLTLHDLIGNQTSAIKQSFSIE